MVKNVVVVPAPVLVPPDPKRCQTDVPNGHSFMTFGGIPGFVRCPNVPAFIATEVHPNKKDGQRGSMSVCAVCLPKLFKQLGAGHVKLEPIMQHVRRAS